MADEYFSAGEAADAGEDEICEDIPIFNIHDKIIDMKDDNTFFISMSFRELIAYSKSWCFNRRIDEAKVKELYAELCTAYHIPYILHAVYDETHKDSVRKLLILDGQHRLEVIKEYVKEKDTEQDCNYKVWVCVYKINHSETSNTKDVIEIFKKINKNRVFDESELPDTYIIDVVKKLCEVKAFKKTKAIRQNMLNNTCHSPFIHVKELNALMNGHKETLKNSNKTVDELVQNIVKLNHIISMKSFEELYTPANRATEKIKYQKAIAIGFFLNLKKSKYPPDVWIRFVCNPDIIT